MSFQLENEPYCVKYGLGTCEQNSIVSKSKRQYWLHECPPPVFCCIANLVATTWDFIKDLLIETVY